MEKSKNYAIEASMLLIWFIWWLIYQIRQDFNVNFFINLGHSIINYQNRIFFVIFINIIIILLKVISKKPRIIHIFVNLRRLIVFILCLIYPFTKDFSNRFWIISNTNISDFYAIFLPIFIMLFFVAKTSDPWDYKLYKEERNEIRNLLSKSLSPYKKNGDFFYNIRIFIWFSFLFALLTWWIWFIGKVKHNFWEIFIKYPTLLFLVLFWCHIMFGQKSSTSSTDWTINNATKSLIKPKTRKSKYDKTPTIKQKLK